MRKKVVVVDSTSVDQKTIMRNLNWRDLGCELVGMAAEGTTGMSIIKQCRPDILISEVQIPGECGLKLASWMHDHLPRSKTILTTASRDFETALRAVELQVHKLVIKPFRNDDLLHAVQSASERLDQSKPHAAWQRAAIEAFPSFSIIKELEHFKHMLTRMDLIEVRKYMQQLSTRLSTSGVSPSSIRSLLDSLCLTVLGQHFQLTRDEYVGGKSTDQILNEFHAMADVEQSLSYLSSLVASINQREHERKEYTPIVNAMLDYIYEHFASNISLSIVAEHFGFSTGYVSRTIRAVTGVNFTDLVTKLRIDTAKRLLLSKKYKIHEAGEQVGYKDYSYFYQAFKRIEGMSPKEYLQSQGDPP